jgi:predicted ester cyclase
MNALSRTVLVTGATGRQGGAVARHPLERGIATLMPLVALVIGCAAAPARTTSTNSDKTGEKTLRSELKRENLVARLVRAGELEVAGADQATIDAYFATEEFRFHGPGGFESDYAGLTAYFASLRSAFDKRSIRRGIMLVDGQYVACQTWIEGTFVRDFTQSPAGPMPPNGKPVTFDLINIFRFDDAGRIAEEWVRADYRSLLVQLGADGR